MTHLAISFDLHKPEFTSLARRRDPETSIAAARKVEREGTVARHERLILSALSVGPMTAQEMETFMLLVNEGPDCLTSVQISRRSGGLIHTKPYRCQYTGTRNGFRIWELIP